MHGRHDPEAGARKVPRDSLRIPAPLRELLVVARRRRAHGLRLRRLPDGSFALLAGGPVLSLTEPEARDAVRGLREAASIDPRLEWAVGTLGWAGRRLDVEVRRCAVGERAVIRWVEPSSATLHLPSGLVRELRSGVHQARREIFAVGLPPEVQVALARATETAGAMTLVETACDLVLLLGGRTSAPWARALAAAAGRSLVRLADAPDDGAAAALARECLRHRPVEPCLRHLVAHLVGSGRRARGPSVRVVAERDMPFRHVECCRCSK